MRNSILQNSRELFSKYGYKKTTMDDIASTLKRGKSSLYYYYKCKEDIFMAVLEKEEDVLFEKLKEVVDSNLSAQEKLRQYVIVRMDTIRHLDNYHKALKEQVMDGYEFFHAMMHSSEQKEVDLIRVIIDQGLRDNEFSVKSPEMAAFGLSTAFKGLEVPLFRGVVQFDDFKVKLNNVLDVLFYGLLKRN